VCKSQSVGVGGQRLHARVHHCVECGFQFVRRADPKRLDRQTFDPLWNELFPAQQFRIIELLVERVDVRTDRVDIKLRIAGATSLIGELTGHSTIQQDAA
jgi:hypothetical protein